HELPTIKLSSSDDDRCRSDPQGDRSQLVAYRCRSATCVRTRPNRRRLIETQLQCSERLSLDSDETSKLVVTETVRSSRVRGVQSTNLFCSLNSVGRILVDPLST